MIDINKLTDEYIEKHDVVFELIARGDEGVIIKKTGVSADDVTGWAWAVDEAVKDAALNELEDKAELEAQAKLEDAIQEVAA